MSQPLWLLLNEPTGHVLAVFRPTADERVPSVEDLVGDAFPVRDPAGGVTRFLLPPGKLEVARAELSGSQARRLLMDPWSHWVKDSDPEENDPTSGTWYPIQDSPLEVTVGGVGTGGTVTVTAPGPLSVGESLFLILASADGEASLRYEVPATEGTPVTEVTFDENQIGLPLTPGTDYWALALADRFGPAVLHHRTPSGP